MSKNNNEVITPSLNREGWGGSPVDGSFTHHIYSPYRVCPLGAHVDHQHGLVTGFAINKGVDLWFNVREDGIVKLKSLSFEGNIEFDISRPTQVREHNWGDYARGAKYALRKRFERHPRLPSCRRTIQFGSCPYCLCHGFRQGQQDFSTPHGGHQDCL